MRSIKKIAIIHPTFAYNGGAESLIINTIEEWQKDGFDITVYTRTIREECRDSINQKYANLSINNPFSWNKTVKYLFEELFKFDIVIIHNFPATIFYGLVVRKAKKMNASMPLSFWYCHEPSVRLYGHDEASFRVRNKTLDPFAVITKIYDKMGVSAIDHIFANSERTKNHVDLVYGRSATVVYPAIKINYNVEKNIPKHFFYVGRIEKPKNIETAIYAFELLLKNTKYKDIKFFIAGSGRDKERLKKIVSERNMNSNIIFLGYISDSDKYKYLSESYALVMPALYEPFGLTVVEAWMSGTTAVMSSDTGVAEIAENAVVFADVLSEHSLCEAMTYTLENEDSREELIENGKNIIENHSLGIDKYAKKLLDKILLSITL